MQKNPIFLEQNMTIFVNSSEKVSTIFKLDETASVYHSIVTVDSILPPVQILK